MTPTEIKAQEKSSELIGIFYDEFSTSILDNEMALKCCDQVLETLNSIKGIGKIHKVSFWKKVKENIENES